MGNRKVTFSENEFYHVYNRGTDKRKVFLDQADYYRFIQLLYLTNTTSSINVRDITKLHSNVFDWKRPDVLVAIGTYCLMPNHFHICVTPVVDNGVPAFMKKLGTAYTMYFNKRYNRTGSLFQGVFKAQHADTDEYLKYLYAYIHLNPVKLLDPAWKETGIKDLAKSYNFASSFQYSSLQDYLGSTRPEKAIINPESFPEYFKEHSDTKRELFDWLNFNPILQ